MISWTKSAGDCWHNILAPGAAQLGNDHATAIEFGKFVEDHAEEFPESENVYDGDHFEKAEPVWRAHRLKEEDGNVEEWIVHYLHTLLPGSDPGSEEYPEKLYKLYDVVRARYQLLRLLLYRRTMISLEFDQATAELCGDLAVEIVESMERHEESITERTSFRFHMTSVLGGAIIILASILAHDFAAKSNPTPVIDLREKLPYYFPAFTKAVYMLKELGKSIQLARRVVSELDELVEVVLKVNTGVAHPVTVKQVKGLLASSAMVSEVPGHCYKKDRDGEEWNADEGGDLESWRLEVHRGNGEMGVPWL